MTPIPTGVPKRAGAGEPRRARRLSGEAPPTAWSATPRPAARSMPAASASSCRSARSIRPTSRRDKETGIGNYSDQDFLNAVHRGIRRDGARLYPAMPYTSYTYITDDDALAIKAYLFSLPPVRAAAPANTLSFPFNQRWGMMFWSALFNPDTRFEPDTSQSPEWNSGAYLAEALAHCGECHTPRNLAFALNNRKKFAGAVTAGWHAFNITSDKATGIGGWSDDDLVYLSLDRTRGGHGTASGPMGEAVDQQSQLPRAGRHPRHRRLSAQPYRQAHRQICRRRRRRRRRLRTRTAATADSARQDGVPGRLRQLPRLDRRKRSLATGDA